MAFKFVLFAALVAVAKAGNIAAPFVGAPVAIARAPVAVAAPVVAKTVVDADYDPNPQYSYAYDIQDAITGDSKNHVETRNGDVVQGEYSLVDPDGTRRIVQYTADPINGFNAVVHREPLVKAVAAAPVAKIATPLSYAAPIAKVAAPLAYAQPIAHAPLGYTQPIAHAPLGYAQPIAHAPLGYAQPIAHAPLGYAQPIAHGPIAYGKTLIH